MLPCVLGTPCARGRTVRRRHHHPARRGRDRLPRTRPRRHPHRRDPRQHPGRRAAGDRLRTAPRPAGSGDVHRGHGRTPPLGPARRLDARLRGNRRPHGRPAHVPLPAQPLLAPGTRASRGPGPVGERHSGATRRAGTAVGSRRGAGAYGRPRAHGLAADPGSVGTPGAVRPSSGLGARDGRRDPGPARRTLARHRAFGRGSRRCAGDRPGRRAGASGS